jgi:hypothetical protein
LGHHVQARNRDNFLSLDFGLREFGLQDETERLSSYRRFVYDKGSLRTVEKEQEGDFKINAVDRFRYRTRYFTDSGIIGTKSFVLRFSQSFKDYFSSRHEKRPKAIKGLDGIYSLKRLSERI